MGDVHDTRRLETSVSAPANTQHIRRENPPALLVLQTAAGNRAVAGMLQRVVQRCGDVPASQCPCHQEGEQPIAARAADVDAPPNGSIQSDLGNKLKIVAADLRAVHRFALAKAEQDGMIDAVGADLLRLITIATEVEAVANGSDENLKANVLQAFGPRFVAEAEALAITRARDEGENAEGLTPSPVAQRYAATTEGGGRPGRITVQRQVAETLVLVGSGMVGSAETAAPVAAATGPPGWITDAAILVVGAALIGIGVYMASAGNVADTGIMEEARELIRTGRAADICTALEILMSLTTDSRRKMRIKATQKAMGCRHSRHS